MDRVCIDASIAIAWLSYGKYTASANALRQEWLRDGVELLGPPVFHAEVTSVLRREVFSKRMLPEEGEEALSICLDIPIRTIDGKEIHRAAWRLAKEVGLPVCYDTQYLAVAELEGCEFWTSDRRLVNLTQKNRSWVKWVGDYGQKTPATPESSKQGTIPRLGDPGLWRKF